MGLSYLEMENTGSQVFTALKKLITPIIRWVTAIWSTNKMGLSYLECENTGSQLYTAPQKVSYTYLEIEKTGKNQFIAIWNKKRVDHCSFEPEKLFHSYLEPPKMGLSYLQCENKGLHLFKPGKE